MRWIVNIILAFASLGLLGCLAVVAIIGFAIHHYGKDLPDYKQLKEYTPSIITRIYAGDGNLLAEYAQEKRIFVPIQRMPDIVKQAFLSAEDKNFYNHSGVDYRAIIRAMIINIRNYGSNRRLVGASTITQQVAKNFLLTNEVSYERKIKEVILAIRMERALSKDILLELYLNQIFLGQRSYGVASAAMTYFGKSLDELSIHEAAYLAALPKAPNNYHPVRKHQAAFDRRNWVIGRLAEDGHIEEGQAELEKVQPLVTITKNNNIEDVEADFFAEEVRRIVKGKYGRQSLYQGGLSVRTTIDLSMQDIAVKTLRDGLMAYDKRHGWRGAVATLKSNDNWQEDLNKIATPKGMLDQWQLAVVLSVKNNAAQIGFADGGKASLPLSGVKWARQCLQDCYALGREITKVNQVLKAGHVIMVEAVKNNTEKESWVLRQVPKIQGALIALDPHTGRVLAMQGGWSHSASSFNRSTQAMRQPGSAFKPFVYLAALDQGLTPSTLVLDAPFVIEQAPGDFWRPTNYSNKYYGPSTLRLGIEKSRNLMTVRLADEIGMDKVSDYAQKFGIADNMKDYLSYSLGAAETTLLRMTSAYGMLANGGHKIIPSFIDRIQDRQGKTIFSFDQRPCVNCGDLIRWDGQSVPRIPDNRTQISNEQTTYQIVSMLQGVVERGTARKLSALDRPLAGKTGTTNQSKDAWFIGFSPNLVVGVFVGFDDPKSMGKRETGSSVAAPIWGDFMELALQDSLPVPFRVPKGIKNVRVNAKTGRLAQANDQNVIWESFVSGTEPSKDDYYNTAQIIGAHGLIDPYGNDPYGYNQFGYSDYSNTENENFITQDNQQYPPTIQPHGSNHLIINNSHTSNDNNPNVEIYDISTEDRSISYFARQRQLQKQQQEQREKQTPDYQEPRTAPTKRPTINSNEITGTGGLY